MIIIFIKIFILDLFIKSMIIRPSLLDKIYNKIQLNIYIKFGFCVKKSTVKTICFIILILNIYVIINIFIFIFCYYNFLF